MQNKFIELFPLKYKFFHFFAQKEPSVPLRNLSVMGIRLFAFLCGSPIYTNIPIYPSILIHHHALQTTVFSFRLFIPNNLRPKHQCYIRIRAAKFRNAFFLPGESSSITQDINIREGTMHRHRTDQPSFHIIVEAVSNFMSAMTAHLP